MSRSFTLNQLTEGIRNKNMGAEGQRLMEKWTRTGLLRGLDDQKRETMSRLLENQAAQLLREANSVSTGAGGLTSSGDINGFSNIAFPIVRRVFGGLVANELVSIQPMSLPSGLLFYLDYTYGTDVGGDNDLNSDDDGALAATQGATYARGNSIYGGPAGKSIREGANATGGQYDLVGSSYTKVHKSSAIGAIVASGAFGSSTSLSVDGTQFAHATGSDGKLLQFDVQLSRRIEAGTHAYNFLILNASDATLADFDITNAKSFALRSRDVTTATAKQFGLGVIDSEVQDGQNILNVRRLNQIGSWDSATNTFTPDPFVAQASRRLLVVVSGTINGSEAELNAGFGAHFTGSYAIADTLDATSDASGSTLTIPSFESNFTADPDPVIPEIDIKIESIAVTATTRKLRARWSPELAQDLNAYHSLDAEVELTQILSEQIALEIDREILNDLLVEAKGANYYWSRSPGKFVNKSTGALVTPGGAGTVGPSFTGTVREWYETLVETIIDVANEIHRKTLRGSANFVVCSPEVATIFEASVLYKPNIKLDGQGQASAQFQLGAAPIGSLSNRFTVYKDPYFPRNKILVGFKGGSYLETGYVYAPYVPLIVTPTIFAPEDFTPRKGVMTRYGKKMVRADFYGTITCLDMDVI
jgi:hypothetical protein